MLDSVPGTSPMQPPVILPQTPGRSEGSEEKLSQGCAHGNTSVIAILLILSVTAQILFFPLGQQRFLLSLNL